MQISNDTLNVLKNFSSINPSVLFKPGQTLRTISPQKTVMAAATIGETVPSEAAVYDLSRFLATLGLFEKPEVEFGDSKFTISAGRSKLKYTYASPTMIITPPEKDINLPDPELTTVVPWKTIDSVIRAAGVLSLGEIAFVASGNEVTVSAIDSKNPTADSFDIVIKDDYNGAPFTMVIRTDNLKLMPADYEVSLSSKGMAHFKSNTVQYWVAVEAR
jgi:hypothetical protein